MAVIDVHGHYTTSPPQHEAWRRAQIAAEREGTARPPSPVISDDEIRRSIETNQLRVQHERGVDLTLFSPRAGSMGHHLASAAANAVWSAHCNDLIARVVDLFPADFRGVAQLPQAPGGSPVGCVAELRRCVEELGFVGCNVNPDPAYPGDYDFAVVGAHPQRWDALQEGRIDAALQLVPYDYIAAEAGYTLLGAAADYVPDYAFGAVAADIDWANAHREVTEHALDAMRESVAWTAEHRDGAADILARATHADRDHARRAVDLLIDTEVVPLDLRIKPAALESIFDSVRQAGPARRPGQRARLSPESSGRRSLPGVRGPAAGGHASSTSRSTCRKGPTRCGRPVIQCRGS